MKIMLLKLKLALSWMVQKELFRSYTSEVTLLQLVLSRVSGFGKADDEYLHLHYAITPLCIHYMYNIVVFFCIQY